MKIAVFAKSFFILFCSHFILRIAYDRLVFGQTDLRPKSLAELIGVYPFFVREALCRFFPSFLTDFHGTLGSPNFIVRN